MTNKITIAIDGWSSCGKSTLAKELARALDYLYIDSGAMYRAITLYFLRNHVDWRDNTQVADALKSIDLRFQYNEESRHSDLYMNDENVEYLIRDLIVAENVSEVATIKEVRDFAVDRQREMGAGKGIVMDGRDIGTVVFPDAELKIFLTADISVRVERRFREMLVKNPNVTIEEVKANLEMRDYIDSHRDISPLRMAEDSLLLDNTNMTIEKTFKEALKMAQNTTSVNSRC